MKAFPVLLVAVSVSALAISGCHVTENKDGKKSNVAVTTPFGSMQVKTDESNDASMTGLTVYPGATAVHEKDEKHNSADVNLSFGDFHLGVKAATYQTGDPVDKVIDFYRKDMAKYGDVIECKDNQPVGTPTRTSQGLTCDEKKKTNVHVQTDDSGHKNEIELRTGSQHLQRIVGVQQKDGATRIGLVYLNLPTDLDHKDNDAE
jgi:hypothetical protein